MKKRTIQLALTMIVSASMLFGCGNKMSSEMTTYKASMETFCDNITYINDEINSIDPESDSAVTDLLSDLDTLEDQFNQMAELEVPENFAYVDELADAAAENMSKAVSFYHTAYENGAFDQNYVDAAGEYYERANTRLQYILDILHGKDVTKEIQERYANTTEASVETSNETSIETTSETE